MKERAKLPSKNKLLGALAGLSVASAIGAAMFEPKVPAAKPLRAHCQAVEAELWQSLHSEAAVPILAKAMNIPEARVDNGGFGPAYCEEGISRAAIKAGVIIRTSLPGVAIECMVVAVTDKKQDLGHLVTTACAAETISTQSIIQRA
jgi:hypothetical protein